MDPNCEKMFDNGNFRRKRKRRSDPSGAGGVAAAVGATKVEDGRAAGGAPLKPSDSPHLLGPSSPELDAMNDNHKGSAAAALSPPGLAATAAAPAPCFNNFYSSMSTLSSGAPSRPQASLGLVNELSSRNITALSPYHANHGSGQDAGAPSEHGEGLHFNRGVYYNTYGQSGQFNSHFYNSFSVNSLIYPREGAEL